MSVYRALQATRFLPNLSGAAPYRLSKSSIKFSRIGYFGPLILLSGFAAQLYLSWKDVPTSNYEIKILLLATASWLQYITGVYGIVKDGLCQKNLIEIVRSIDIYDKRSGYSKDNNGKRENERVLRWSIAYSCAIAFLALARYLTWRKIHYYVIMEIVNMLINNGIYMFVVLTTLLGLRLRHLNSIVNKNVVTTVREKGTAPETCDPANPEYLRELYTSLCRTGELLNSHYSDRLFLWSAYAMISLLRQIYVFITEKLSTQFVAALIVQIIPVVLGLLIYCMACQFTVGQANKIVSALLEKSIRHTARINRGRKEIFTMGLYMALRPFEFSALGFFSVDFSLTYAIATTAVTYVTLCIQSGGA